MQKQVKSVVVPILVTNIIFFVIQLISPWFTYNFMLVSKDIFVRPWILITSMFLHDPGNINHIIFNMYGLIIFGPLLEQRIGWKRFLIIYLFSGIVAAFASSFVYTSALGASAAIMGMIGTLIVLLPNLRLLFFFFIPMPLWTAGIIWALLDFFGLFIPTGIGNLAHLVGMGTGLIFGIYLRRVKKTYHRKFIRKVHLNNEDLEEFLKSGRI